MKPLAFILAFSLTLVHAKQASAFTYIEQYAFITTETGDIAVLDTKTDSIVTKIKFETRPRSLIVDESEKLLLSVPTIGTTIEVFDLSAENAAPAIDAGFPIDLIQYDPAHKLLAVANMELGIISFINILDRKTKGSVSGLGDLTSIIFSRSGEKLFATSKSSSVVAVIDTAAARIIKSAVVGTDRLTNSEASGGLRSLDKTPNGRYALAIPEDGSSDISIVDLTNVSVFKEIRLTNRHVDRAYSTGDGAFMLASSDANQAISIVSMASLSEVANLRGGAKIADINTAWFETTAFAVDQAESNVVILDLVGRDVAAVLHLPGVPGKSAVTPDGLKLYIPLIDTRAVAIVDARARRLTKLIDGMNFSPEAIYMAGNLAFCH